MKKHIFTLLPAAVALLLATACNPKGKTTTEVETQTEETADAVHSLPDYNYTDSLMQGSHKVIYAITCHPDDSLAVIVDEDGVKYKDNRFWLTIMKDDKTLFSRSFTKADFRSQLPQEFQKYGIMDGMRFDRAEEGKLYFNTCVSYPESDMSCPFILTIGPDGSYTIEPDTTSDEEDDEFPSI